jgi:Ca2+-binding EF-hand superfamily protein
MNQEKVLREIFDSYDRNHNGTIEASELKTAYAESGIPISDAEITVMVI